MTWINDTLSFDAMDSSLLDRGAWQRGSPGPIWGHMVEHWSCDVAVIDDDTAVLESFGFMLELAGLRVATFASALAYLDQPDVRPRCLILDHHMPVMTGLELAARLRQGGDTVPILLITSASSPAILARAASIGVVRVIDKPPTEDELIAFVAGC